MGPTAAGKTALALALAERLPIDIISVDSAQIYRGMDIGTAKPTAQELACAPHRLIDIRDPSETYSAAEFCQDAKREIENSLQQQRIPILVGGTMLYFHALQNGLAPLPSADPNIRQHLADDLQQYGSAVLHKRLQECDPETAARVHPNDPQRISRALEVYQSTGKPLSELLREPHTLLPYKWINTILAPESRELLHQRIEARLDNMLAHGFIEEVQTLFSREDLHLGLPSLRMVGYRQIWETLASDNQDNNALRQAILIATRQFSKRQLTWCRRWKNAISLTEPDQTALEKIVSELS